MNKKQFSETDVKTKFITPTIIESGWDIKNKFWKRNLLPVLELLLVEERLLRSD